MDTVTTQPADAEHDDRILSALCATGAHRRCTGRVHAPTVGPDGRAYVRCECPKCDHPHETRGRGGPR